MIGMNLRCPATGERGIVYARLATTLKQGYIHG